MIILFTGISRFIFIALLSLIEISAITFPDSKVKFGKACANGIIIGALSAGFCLFQNPEIAHSRAGGLGIEVSRIVKQSPRWELSRQKRTAAVKQLEEKGLVKIDTDDSGNQFLSLPWLPQQKILYKSLSISQKLQNEVFAGAMGELVKDCLLHPVDTAKARRQSRTKSAVDESVPSGETSPQPNFLQSATAFYAGFPVVLLASIPQGSAFFLVKKGLDEVMNNVIPDVPRFVAAAIPIGFGVIFYWLFRTPAEVIKTKVQTSISPNVTQAFKDTVDSSPNGVLSLYKFYPVMLWLDIPFQIVNFILYGSLTSALSAAGYQTSIATRLFSGITCGMIAAGLTCPIDTCKTRMIRGKTQSSSPLSTISSPLPSTMSPSLAVSASGGDGSQHIQFSSVSPAADETAAEVMSQATMAMEEGASNTALCTPVLVSSQAGVVVNAQTEQLSPESATNTTLSGEQSSNLFVVMRKIYTEEGFFTLFSGIKQRLAYTGLANGIRLAVYGTARMDLMMRSLDDI